MSTEQEAPELGLPTSLPPGIGLKYDGSLVNDYPWSLKPGLYIIRPEVYEDCNLSRLKIGYSQMNLDETRGICKRLADYATSFISIRVISVITWRDNTEASKAEQEAHAWLEANSPGDRIMHVSGKRKSEWFTDVDLETANRLVSHLLLPNWLSKPLIKYEKTQPKSAFFFTIPLEMNEQGTVPSEVDLNFRVQTSWDSKDLRDVRDEMQAEEDPEYKELLRQGTLSMLNYGIDIEPMTEITERGRDRYGNRRLGSTTRTVRRGRKKKKKPAEVVVQEEEEEEEEEAVEEAATPSAPRYNTRYQVRKMSIGEQAMVDLF